MYFPSSPSLSLSFFFTLIIAKCDCSVCVCVCVVYVIWLFFLSSLYQCVCVCALTKKTRTWDYAAGSTSHSSSFSDAFSFSGNLMSNATNMSPFRDGSFGSGSPYPVIRFTVFGLMISCMVLIRSLSPVIVGTSKTTPQRACAKRKRDGSEKNVWSICLLLLMMACMACIVFICYSQIIHKIPYCRSNCE